VIFSAHKSCWVLTALKIERLSPQVMAAALWPGIQGTGAGIRRSAFCSHLYHRWPWAK